jgi:hypothetical protein
MDSLEKVKQLYDYIVQTFEYDMKILQIIKFEPKFFKDK